MHAAVAESEAVRGHAPWSIPRRRSVPHGLQDSCFLADEPLLRRYGAFPAPPPGPARRPRRRAPRARAPPARRRPRRRTDRAEQVEQLWAFVDRRAAELDGQWRPEARRLRHPRRLVQHADEREHDRRPRARGARRARRRRPPRRAHRADGRRAHARPGVPGRRAPAGARDGPLPRPGLDAGRRQLPAAARARLARPAGRRGARARDPRPRRRRAARGARRARAASRHTRPPTPPSTPGRVSS